MSIMEEATVEEPVKLNRKDITEEITGIDLELREEDTQKPGEEQQEPDELNPLVDVVDCGLDFAEEFLQDAGYPPLKRKVWEDHGKKALSKAINAYCPPGSPLGGTMDTPLVALLIGIGALLLCFWPVIQRVLQDREKPATTPAAEEQQPEPGEEKNEFVNTYEEPKPPAVKSTAPISDKALAAWERVQRVDNGY